jgi:hypothetical protein
LSLHARIPRQRLPMSIKRTINETKILLSRKILQILLAMYGPAADVKEKSFVQRRGTDAVMYPASESRFLVSCGP